MSLPSKSLCASLGRPPFFSRKLVVGGGVALGSGWLEGDQAGLREGGRAWLSLSLSLFPCLSIITFPPEENSFPRQAQVYTDGLSKVP